MHAQSCLTLYHPMNYSTPGFSVHGIIQSRILEWVAISSSRGSSQPGTEPASPAAPGSSCIGRWLHYHYHFFTWEAPQSSAITALQGELVSPKGTQEGKEYLPSSCRQTTATPYGGPWETMLRT